MTEFRIEHGRMVFKPSGRWIICYQPPHPAPHFAEKLAQQLMDNNASTSMK